MSLAVVTNRGKEAELNKQDTQRGGREKQAVRSNSGFCISYHAAAMFVYFLPGVNIYAWLQPSHLHMSPLCTITHTLSTNTHTLPDIPKPFCAHTQTLTIQPFKPHLNLVLCINPTHKVSGTSQTIHSIPEFSAKCVHSMYYYSRKKTLLSLSAVFYSFFT